MATTYFGFRKFGDEVEYLTKEEIEQDFKKKNRGKGKWHRMRRTLFTI